MAVSSPLPRPLPPRVAVLSDLHITDVEAADPRRPLWRRYKQEAFHPDQPLLRLIDHLESLAAGERVELVLNGDVFDFDTVLARPTRAAWKTSWLERARGLSPEEDKSTWKMQRILDHHPALVARLRAWLAAGHALVFVIGNHDLELHWPAVQRVLVATLQPPEPDAVRICAWCVMRGDTFITHGNQLDDYCVCQDPVHPFVEKNGVARVRMPFGNLAGKLILNGMGLFSPHVDDSFIRSPVEYLRFFFQHLARTQPFILWSWMWSSFATLGVTLDEGLRPSIRDPLTLATREAEIVEKAGITPDTLRAL